MDASALIEPQDMLTIDRCGDTLDHTDKFALRDVFSSKRSFAMDWVIGGVYSMILSCSQGVESGPDFLVIRRL
jgi:hypothetical protein